MQSKNKRTTQEERDHLGRVKEMDCVVCDAPGPSDAHHIRQDLAFTCLPLCKSCHQGSISGWHGQKAAWKIKHWDELDALNETIRRMM